MSFVTRLPERHYQPEAFGDFTPSNQVDIGSARALMWLSQLAYENCEEKIKRVLDT
jgi:hypothetical protein